MVSAYEAKNLLWTESANQLRNFADIRNILTHQRGTNFGYPIAVTAALVSFLDKINEQLHSPEAVSVRYRRSVKCVTAESTLAAVLELAFKNEFSQFPVISNGQFAGLITENEIIRWLGHRVMKRSVEVNLAAASVRMVLKEKAPPQKGISIFHFEKLDAPVDEVIGRFSAEPSLEVILLNESGNKKSPIEGIVTQWDAARYRG